MWVVEAANLNGYAWSETIGWVSFSGLPYGVKINDTTGNFSGHGWSENVGWVKFDPVGPYPAAPLHSARLNLATGKVAGWGRALAFDDDWDGWIRMDGFEHSVKHVGNSASGCRLTGYAWGAQVVGWLKFNHVEVVPCLIEGEEVLPIKDLSCNFSAFPRRIITPQRTSRLSWTCRDADRCSITPGIGVVNNAAGSVVVGPSRTVTYTLKCDNDQNQSVAIPATVTVVRSRICETIPYFPGCP